MTAEFYRMGFAASGVELLEKRTLLSKSFALPDGSINLQTSMAAFHYLDDNNQFQDIDLTPEDMGDHWLIQKAPYVLQIAKNTPQFALRDKATGLQVSVKLGTIDGVAPNLASCTPVEHPSGHALCFQGALGDGHLSIVARPQMAHTQQDIFSAKGLRTLSWIVEQNDSTPIVLETFKTGTDANKNDAEIIVNRTPLIQVGSVWRHQFTEQVTGKILRRPNRATRTPVAGAGVVYPLRVVS